MTLISLPIPVYLKKNIKVIAERLNIDEELLDGLCLCADFLLPESDKPEEIRKRRKTVNAAGEELGSERPKESIIGPTAVEWLCDRHKEKFEGLEHPLGLREIKLEGDFYSFCEDKEWMDISYLLSKVEMRADRYRRLQELNAPSIILDNEARMLVEYVRVLEGEYPTPEERDGRWRHVANLHDVEYSLVDGWSQQHKNDEEDSEERYSIEPCDWDDNPGEAKYEESKVDLVRFKDLMNQAVGPMTKTAFAELAGVSRAYLTRLCSPGNDQLPSPNFLAKVASASNGRVDEDDLRVACGLRPRVEPKETQYTVKHDRNVWLDEIFSRLLKFLEVSIPYPQPINDSKEFAKLFRESYGTRNDYIVARERDIMPVEDKADGSAVLPVKIRMTDIHSGTLLIVTLLLLGHRSPNGDFYATGYKMDVQSMADMSETLAEKIRQLAELNKTKLDIYALPRLTHVSDVDNSAEARLLRAIFGG